MIDQNPTQRSSKGSYVFLVNSEVIIKTFVCIFIDCEHVKNHTFIYMYLTFYREKNKIR